MKRRSALVALVLLAAPLAASGQGLAERITGGGDGAVRMSFPSREGVQICDDGIRLFGDRVFSRGPRWREGSCAPGPIEVEFLVRGAKVEDVETLDGTDRRSTGARDIGVVSAPEAARFLLETARAEGVENAILPALLAGVPEPWKAVMDLATDRGARGKVRRTALFWLGQEAAEAATEGLAEVASDEAEDQAVRDAAVFALSQRPSGEGVSALMEVARTARDPKTRRSAFFWLAQSDDARVLPFFREILRGPRGG